MKREPISNLRILMIALITIGVFFAANIFLPFLIAIILVFAAEFFILRYFFRKEEKKEKEGEEEE
jgi:predicted membrane protein